ncbi:bifunctional helix-turn-helix transcriptional regulator/GNAT family N-acetyltransferase [Dictyobacter kobayashii]|uniref:GNAT family N-acetyltransferase n=1 Tax=Dictyobacter kobayashii TaxID=2014872 RepID=A0A402AR53_9CHLR|nr:bifunctional helix-turn-helix transcriptional regulator/GNAT family N-acetyltransferase [Dictyobacter kobayashii]GCE21584.1 GNAT family N-acetyltransferase [Dictyobacter kobayashii]
MLPEAIDERVKVVRHFNRSFTRQIGVLREGLLHSPYTLTEARIMFEIAHREQTTASHLGRELGLDPGYLSRLLTRLEQQALIEKRRSDNDGRQFLLELTDEGKQAAQLLDQRSRDEVAEMLNTLSEQEQQRLLKAMQEIEGILTRSFKFSEPFFLRSHQPGDIGWVAHRHGVLYAREFGWDERFEALVAQIVADFVNNYDPLRDHCWIAEMKGEIVGSVFVVRASESVARLRLLLVEPKARGLGLGTYLVEECIRFARQHGYQKLQLWTNSVLVEARHIYQKTGFKMIEQESHHSFGHDLIGETWELIL